MFKYLVIYVTFSLVEYSLCYPKFHPSHGLRIVGGKSANILDYPYQVAIMFDDEFQCGGSIIGESYILTAAHCTYVNKRISIRVGSSFRDSGGQVVRVDKVYQHPKFNIDTYDYDIAILHLKKQLVFRRNVNMIQVLPVGQNISNNEIAIATGWGKMDFNGDYPEQLQVVSLPTISTEKCQKYYGPIVTNRMFCAGYPEGKKDTCQGDSGGPLVMDSMLIGITSWGEVCGAPNFPGVFTKISVVKEFIDEILKAENGTSLRNRRS